MISYQDIHTAPCLFGQDLREFPVDKPNVRCYNSPMEKLAMRLGDFMIKRSVLDQSKENGRML